MNVNDDMNINKNQIQKPEKKNFSIHIKSSFISCGYQYMINNSSSSLNKSKYRDNKDDKNTYMNGKGEDLNHLIYFTNSANKNGKKILTTSKAKTDV